MFVMRTTPAEVTARAASGSGRPGLAHSGQAATGAAAAGSRHLDSQVGRGAARGVDCCHEVVGGARDRCGCPANHAGGGVEIEAGGKSRRNCVGNHRPTTAARQIGGNGYLDDVRRRVCRVGKVARCDDCARCSLAPIAASFTSSDTRNEQTNARDDKNAEQLHKRRIACPMRRIVEFSGSRPKSRPQPRRGNVPARHRTPRCPSGGSTSQAHALAPKPRPCPHPARALGAQTGLLVSGLVSTCI